VVCIDQSMLFFDYIFFLQKVKRNYWRF
jgi:hypothetical protein